MRPCLKLLHLLALAAFLGRVFGHILLGQLADPTFEPEAFALLEHAKHVSTLVLTAPGLALTLASGIGLLALRPDFLRTRWMILKLGLAALVSLNAFLLLIPLGGEIATVAAMPDSRARLAELTRREAMLGAGNLVMVLAIMTLVIAARPATPARGRA